MRHPVERRRSPPQASRTLIPKSKFALIAENMRKRAGNIESFIARTMQALAQELVYSLKDLMPTQYQKDNFDAMMGLFLSALLAPLPEHSLTKSPSALSRFLNINPRSSRDMKRDCPQPCIRDGFKDVISIRQRT